MKKFFSMALVVIAAVAVTSCGNDNPKAHLKTNIDSLSYAYGVQCTQGFDSYVQQMGIDTIYMSEFYKGIIEGYNAGDNKKRNAYFEGLKIGMQLNTILANVNHQLTAEDSVEFLSRDNFLAGFINAAKKKGVALTNAQVDSLINYLGQKISAENTEKVAQKKRKAGQEFLAKKAKEAGVQKMPSGLLYKVINEGEGESPSENALVKVHYEGKLIDGTVFDASTKHGTEPTQFRANQVIQGWTEALTHMKKGAKWQLFIPENLAYGERQAGQIPPYSALQFTVELVDFEEPEAAKE